MIYDYIIVGTGVAGLNAARLIPKDKRVLILCKMSTWNCNTFWAQGGIASAVDESDIPTHIKDTLEAGVNYNDKNAVELLSHKSISTIKNLIHDGMKFDLNNEGKLAYTKEAAHSRNRILHADGDATGRMIHIFLLEHCQHEIVTQAVVCDLLIKDDICYGVQYFVSETEQKVAFAHTTILASGGVGSIYKYHTNSTANAGEVQGIISSHGIPLADMEMMQFHPTAFVLGNSVRKQLLSESLRGEGAMVVDEDGKRFVFDYDSRGELAPRDVVSRAIFKHKQQTNKEVYLDLSAFSKEHFKQRFPSIYFNMTNIGYNVPEQKIPISPAFHYSMGGIKTDLHGRVHTIKNIYAVGECAHTGVHGANRLASNSLLEGLVFSARVAEEITKSIFEPHVQHLFTETEEVLIRENDKTLKNELRHLMWNYAGIIREKQTLQTALNRVKEMLGLPIGKLLRLRLLVSQEIITSALKRKTSLGAHYIKEEVTL